MLVFQEHPSVGQLAEKLLENTVYSIFAVDQLQYQWYEVISPPSEVIVMYHHNAFYKNDFSMSMNHLLCINKALLNLYAKLGFY